MEFLFVRIFCIWTLIIQFLYSVHVWEGLGKDLYSGKFHTMIDAVV